MQMSKKINYISVPLSFDETEIIKIFSEHETNTSLKEIDIEEALENGESKFQLMEGSSYEYSCISGNYILESIPGIVNISKRDPASGRITPNIYVGTLSINVLDKETNEKVDILELEVRSIKTSYRKDYRFMLEVITEKCTDLLMQSGSPVSHQFETDYDKDSSTIYQKFAFISSIINSEEFNESVYKIVSSPTTKWTENSEPKDVRQIRRLSNSGIKQIISGSSGIKLPFDHVLRKKGLESIPAKINAIQKADIVDTPENRFVKHALEVFFKFCSNIETLAEQGSRLHKEAAVVAKTLESHLHHSVFKEISRPVTLRLNSPVLQRKEGYREVLRTWLMFDLAAKLIWKGGEDVYKGGKKDIAVLYEYWLFFVLLDLFKEIFEIEPKQIQELIQPTRDGLGLQLIQGSHTAIKGVYVSEIRNLNIRFSYNRTFSGNKTYPERGSWTKTMRPDYTLSFWPYGINEKEAEKQELIVHIHFDAKYKIENLFQIIGNDEDLNFEKKEHAKGKYKNADLLKMHAYKDAIRRTVGAYVLYPGDQFEKRKGFHEIIPGLGAFPVKPSRNNSGISDLKAFIKEIISHFLNRASQREKTAFRTYDIHKNRPNELRVRIPENYKPNRGLIPDETSVLVCFYNSEKQLNWIEDLGFYIFEIDYDKDSFVINKNVVSSKYILLCTNENDSSWKIWRIKSNGIQICSKLELIEKGYPNDLLYSNYLKIEITSILSDEFKNSKWLFKQLTKYNSSEKSNTPFAVSLTELMLVIAKD